TCLVVAPTFAQFVHKAREMLIRNIRLIDEGNSLLEVRSKRLRHDLFAQNALYKQARQLVAVPFVEGNLIGGILLDVAVDGAAHLLLHVATEDEANDDLQLLVPPWNSVRDVIVQDFVERW